MLACCRLCPFSICRSSSSSRSASVQFKLLPSCNFFSKVLVLLLKTLTSLKTNEALQRDIGIVSLGNAVHILLNSLLAVFCTNIYLIKKNENFAEEVAKQMYADQNSGVARRCPGISGLGMDEKLLHVLKKWNVRIITSSDAHCPEDVGDNIVELETCVNNA